MTHIEHKPAEWEKWFAEAGLDWVEVLRCPDQSCGHCRRPQEVAAAA